jgi:hypothetical protein
LLSYNYFESVSTAAKPDRHPEIAGALKVGRMKNYIFSETRRARSGECAEVQRQKEGRQVTEG